MEKIVLTAAGKINLFLRVLPGIVERYHYVETLYQSVDIRDRIEIRRGGNTLELETSGIEAPAGTDNLAFRAAGRYFEMTGVEEGIHIRLEKRIPVGAGLGGGSADAAAVLFGCNVLFEEQLDEAELVRLAGSLGCDIPFLLKGGTAIGWGRGDRLIMLSPLPAWPVLICTPDFQVDTASAYGLLDRCKDKKSAEAMIYDPADFYSLVTLGSLAKNDFESVIGKEHPVLFEIRDTFMQRGAKISLLAGSGSAVFSLFASERERAGCQKVLDEEFSYPVLNTRFCAEGIQVEELE